MSGPIVVIAVKYEWERQQKGTYGQKNRTMKNASGRPEIVDT